MIRESALDIARQHDGSLVLSLSPKCGSVETWVTIKGANFGKHEEGNEVRFGDIVATEVEWEPTRIRARVPQNTDTGAVVVTAKVVVPDNETGGNFTMQLTCPRFTVKGK